MSTAEAMDALLEGLSAEDLDMDFDPNEEDLKEDAYAERDVDVEFDDCAPNFVPAGSSQAAPFLGFVTGRNSVIPTPSAEAFAKARKIFDEDPVLAEVASSLPTGEPPFKRPRIEEELSTKQLMPPPRSSGFATAGGKAPPPISSSAQTATVNLFDKPVASGSKPPPALSGFATATGRAPPPISPAATPASQILFKRAEHAAPPARSGFATATGKAPPPISPAAASASRALLQRAEVAATAPAPPTHRSSGFAAAGGSAPPPISRAAAASTESLFSQPDPDDNDDFCKADIPPSSTGSFSLGFQTGAGKAVAAPSTAARARAMAMFENPDPPPSADRAQTPTPRNAFLPFAPPRSSLPPPPALATGSGRPAAPPSQSAKDRVGTIFVENQKSQSGPSTSSGLFNTPMAPTRLRPLATSGLSLGRSAPNQARDRVGAIFLDEQNSRPQSTPPSAFVTPRAPIQSRQSATGVVFRAPLRTTTNTPSQDMPPPSALTGSPAPRKYKPVEIDTPLLRRRVGLGMTPSRSVKGKTTGFAVPFKVGPRVESTPLPRTSAEPIVQPPAPVMQPVFDLTNPPERINYRQAYLKPQYRTMTELMDLGMPQEIFYMEYRVAKAYRFSSDDDRDLGPDEALAELKDAGCQLATPAWVVNHWSMILWKLAGVIEAQYTLRNQLWRWEEVISQLLYRYEREYGRAERPIVRRIHEHDSSPSLPLVLCVSAIVHPPPKVPEEGGQEQTPLPGLELTDGWYRISAQVDECLARAIARGKIRVGRKLAITGAKLQSGGEGVDPLESLDKTLLIIAGNSTKLAPWDGKLGRQNDPFVAGLSSLSVDGGVISLMDVVIDRLFPVAYSMADKGNREEPWGEEEERQRQDAWTEKYAAESTRLQRDMRKQLELLEDVVAALCSAAEGVEDGGGDAPDNVDQIFEALLETKSIDSRLRTMSGRTLVHVAMYGRAQYEKESASAFMEVEAELQNLCPPRQIRDFRIARVLDARQGNKPACRAGMLTIWEAKALGEGSLAEGRRYMVANVVPGRAGDWRPPGLRQDGSRADIYLHTRMDTRWQPIE